MTALAHHQALLAAGGGGVYLGYDPANKGANATLENGNFDLYTGSGGTNKWALSQTKKNSGKWRVQFVHVNHVDTMGGGFALNNALGGWVGSNSNGAVLFGNYSGTMRLYRHGNYAQIPGGIASGGLVDLYLDLDAGMAWWARNGTILAGDPAAGTGPMQTWTGGVDVWIAGDTTGGGGRLRIRTDPATMVGPGIAGFTDGWPS